MPMTEQGRAILSGALLEVLGRERQPDQAPHGCNSVHCFLAARDPLGMLSIPAR